MQFKDAKKLSQASKPSEWSLPPGQFVTDKLPALTYGHTPEINLDQWELHISGLVENELKYTWHEFLKLPTQIIKAPFHCVTKWSRLNNCWEGPLFTEIAKLVKPKSEAKFVIIHCFAEYHTNIALEVLMNGSALLAHKLDNNPLSIEHGWPLRLVVPERYGWKSAKWIKGLEFVAEDRPGFWETRGYHNDGDPWKEQRFWPELD